MCKEKYLSKNKVEEEVFKKFLTSRNTSCLKSYSKLHQQGIELTIFVWKYILRTIWQIMYEELADKNKKKSSCIRNFLFSNSGLCCRLVYYWAFHPFFVTWILVVFGDEVTKILRNSLFTFFTEQGKAGKTEI